LSVLGEAEVHVGVSLETDSSNTEGGAVLNLAVANVTFGTGAQVALGHANDVAVLMEDQAAYKGTVGKYAGAMSGPDDYADMANTVTAVENLMLTEVGTIAVTLTVYVYGTLTVDGTIPATVLGQIIAIKDVAVTGTVGDVSTIAKVDMSKAQISVEGHTGATTVKLPTTLATPWFYLSGQDEVLTVTGTTSIEAYRVAGNVKLVLAAAVTHTDISGYGRVEFADTDDATTALDTGSNIVIGGSGYVSFLKGVSPAADLTLGRKVVIPTTEKFMRALAIYRSTAGRRSMSAWRPPTMKFLRRTAMAMSCCQETGQCLP
jgi:hypothetical protein